MSDVSRYLPLSQRPRSDESGVSGDWSAHFSAVLVALADRLQSLDDADWDAGSGRAGWTVREAIGDVEWRLSATVVARARASVRRRVTRPGAARSEQERPGRGRASAPRAELVAALRAAAAADRRRPLRDLALVVVASLDVDAALPIDRLALGAVAVARSLSAPLAIRAVIRTVTLRASDGGWSVGHGTTVHAPGADIVRFLYGRAGLPADDTRTPDDLRHDDPGHDEPPHDDPRHDESHGRHHG